MGKKALVISYYFAPQNTIGAVRPTKLAKYLVKLGWDVTVICGSGSDGRQDPCLKQDLQFLSDVHIIHEINPLRKWYLRKARRLQINTHSSQEKACSAKPAAESKPSFVHQCADVAYRYLAWLSDRSFYKRAKRKLKSLNHSYDAVFSSYAPVSVHQLACYAKKHGIASRWVADFRDEAGMPFESWSGKLTRFLEMVKSNADVITGVSGGILKLMNIPDSVVLANGFDTEDIPDACSPVHDGVFRVAYCGQLGSARKDLPPRDITPVFMALAALPEQILPRNKLRLVYCGPEANLFRRYAEKCGLEDCVEDHGVVSRAESIAIQQQADALLLASWYTAQQRGILTGKLFEYLMTEKPILCCIAGDLTGSVIKEILDSTGAGYCYEQADPNAQNSLNAYVADLIHEWLEGNDLSANRNEEKVMAYSYPELARQLSGLLEG